MTWLAGEDRDALARERVQIVPAADPLGEMGVTGAV